MVVELWLYVADSLPASVTLTFPLAESETVEVTVKLSSPSSVAIV